MWTGQLALHQHRVWDYSYTATPVRYYAVSGIGTFPVVSTGGSGTFPPNSPPSLPSIFPCHPTISGFPFPSPETGFSSIAEWLWLVACFPVIVWLWGKHNNQSKYVSRSSEATRRRSNWLYTNLVTENQVKLQLKADSVALHRLWVPSNCCQATEFKIICQAVAKQGEFIINNITALINYYRDAEWTVRFRD